MVWLIGGLPATAVIAGITTVFIAAHDPDSLVNDEPVKQGMTVTESRTPADLRAGELGITAEMHVVDDRLVLTLTGNLDPLPTSLTLTLIHPTLPEQDRTVTLASLGKGSYAIALPGDITGKREFLLHNEDKTWRIAGEGILSAEGISLAAKSSQSSTYP